jgi:hypothetical protein
MAARRNVAVGKAYLNRREKDQVYMVAGMVAMLNEWIERGEAHHEKVTELKYARTYLYKHLDSKMGHLPQEDVARIVEGIKKKEVGFYADWRR